MKSMDEGISAASKNKLNSTELLLLSMHHSNGATIARVNTDYGTAQMMREDA